MRKNPASVTARVALGTLFLLTGTILLCLLPLTRTSAQNPATGTIHATDTTSVTWVGTTVTPGGAGPNNGESDCVDSGAQKNCETFTLTVAGTPTDWEGKLVKVQLTWTNNANDYDFFVHQGTNTDPTANPPVAVATLGPGETIEAAFFDPSTLGTGVYTIHVAYATTPDSATDEYHGAVSVVSVAPPATADIGPKIGYENFEAPGVLTPVTVSTGPTVEYMGRGAGEPSIGVNWNSLAPNDVTGVTNFQSDLETLFITFANACPTGGATATWANRRAPTSVVIDSDPIGFTDRQTGRVFAAELSATSPTCKISFSDDDGNNWTATQGTLGSGIDHETVGGGIYNASSVPPPPPHPAYANAVYYCSQDLVNAFCLRSDDGGQHFGPPVQVYVGSCGGLHGHVKVSPTDGTVYLPNNNCGGEGGVVVSEDNGITWTIRNVQTATVPTISGASDPAIGIDDTGRVYFVIASNNSAAVAATSDDHGVTWHNIADVGAVYGLKNIRYPAAVAKDANRAAVAFYGTTTPGNANASNFNGLWHLYVAHTFDGGATWTTTDATPNAPMQRGCIWTGGGARICRNLLDFFDVTVDKQGRVEVGYVNGCPGGNCAQAVPTATGNAYSATATIARQSSGRRLIAAFDPPSPTSVPGMPSITERRVGTVVNLGWSEGDTGNSPITGYQILRGTASGAETFLKTIKGTQAGGTFTDLSASNTSKTYYYKVLAANGVGTSCGNNEIAAPFVGDTCSGMIIHQNDPTHPESAAASANPQLAIDYIAVGEPAGAANNFMFKMKVTNLSTIPPNSRWRMVWDSFASPGQQFFVGMRSDASSTVTFEYGTIATAVVGLVVGVPSETLVGAPLPASNFAPDGTITIFLPKSAVGNPQPGDLLGAVNGRTFTGDTPETKNLERSTALIDHTFVKAQTDNAYPPATYVVLGNPPSVTVTASPTQIQEGQTATYTISCSPAPSKPLAIAIKMSGTAGQGPGMDYTLSPFGKFTIPAGQTSTSVTLTSLAGDPQSNTSETAIMTLQPGKGYCPGTPKSATVTIVQP